MKSPQEQKPRKEERASLPMLHLGTFGSESSILKGRKDLTEEQILSSSGGFQFREIEAFRMLIGRENADLRLQLLPQLLLATIKQEYEKFQDVERTVRTLLAAFHFYFQSASYGLIPVIQQKGEEYYEWLSPVGLPWNELEGIRVLGDQQWDDAAERKFLPLTVLIKGEQKQLTRYNNVSNHQKSQFQPHQFQKTIYQQIQYSVAELSEIGLFSRVALEKLYQEELIQYLQAFLSDPLQEKDPAFVEKLLIKLARFSLPLPGLKYGLNLRNKSSVNSSLSGNDNGLLDSFDI